MKLTVIAATGGVGRLVVDQALAAGHDVTAVARNPQDLPVPAVTVDLTRPDQDALTSAMEGADAVLSGFGPRTRKDAGIVETGTAAVLAALRTAGVRRFVMVSATPVGTTPSPSRPNPPAVDPGDDVLTGRVLYPIIKRVFGAVYADLARTEDLVTASGLDWTVVRPPQLTDGPATGRYRTSTEVNIRGGRRVSRADVAACMLRAATGDEFARRIVRVAAP